MWSIINGTGLLCHSVILQTEHLWPSLSRRYFLRLVGCGKIPNRSSFSFLNSQRSAAWHFREQYLVVFIPLSFLQNWQISFIAPILVHSALEDKLKNWAGDRTRTCEDLRRLLTKQVPLPLGYSGITNKKNQTIIKAPNVPSVNLKRALLQSRSTEGRIWVLTRSWRAFRLKLRPKACVTFVWFMRSAWSHDTSYWFLCIPLRQAEKKRRIANFHTRQYLFTIDFLMTMCSVFKLHR